MSKKLKVLLLGQGPGVGGAERVVFFALKKAESLDVVVAAPDVQCRFAKSLGFETIPLELPRVRTPVIGPANWAIHSMKVARQARRARAAVLYANASRAMGYGIGARIFGGPPLVAHNHHLLAEEDDHRLSGGLASRSRFVQGLERWSSAIVVPSRAAARPFQENKVRIIPNGIDLEHFISSPDKAGAKRSFGLPEDSVVVGTISRAEPGKGMAEFVDIAVRVHKDVGESVTFLLAGGASFPHEKRHYEEVQRRAKQALGDRIVMPGALSDPLQALNAMDIMVHASAPESFGLTVAEAMACRVAVVAFEWGGVVEVAAGGGALLVPPNDLDESARKVSRLVADPKLREEMGRQGEKTAKKFDLNEMSRSLEQLLHEVAG